MKDTLLIYNIYVEDLFTIFVDGVYKDCGDGCGTIVCQNYEEAASMFENWCSDKIINPLRSKRKIVDINHNSVIFTDGNENFIFTNKIPQSNFDGEYVYITKEDCRSYKAEDKQILAIL